MSYAMLENWCVLRICWANSLSFSTFGLSSSTNVKSKRDRIGEGKSIWDDDAQWQFAYINYYDYYSGTDTYVEYQFNLPEGPTLIKEAQKDSTWTFSIEDRLTSEIRLMPSDSLKCWHVVASCNETAKNGMTSVASTTSEGMILRKVWEGVGTSYPYKKNSFSGKFITEISKENEQVDYCTMNFRPGFTPSYTTSRD